MCIDGKIPQFFPLFGGRSPFYFRAFKRTSGDRSPDRAIISILSWRDAIPSVMVLKSRNIVEINISTQIMYIGSSYFYFWRKAVHREWSNLRIGNEPMNRRTKSAVLCFLRTSQDNDSISFQLVLRILLLAQKQFRVSKCRANAQPTPGTVKGSGFFC